MQKETNDCLSKERLEQIVQDLIGWIAVDTSDEDAVADLSAVVDSDELDALGFHCYAKIMRGENVED